LHSECTNVDQGVCFTSQYWIGSGTIGESGFSCSWNCRADI